MTIDDFLAEIEKKQPPAPREALAAFEKTIGSPLPDDYRKFLIKCNGGYLGGSVAFEWVTPEGRVGAVGIHHIGGFRDESHYSLVKRRECYDDRIPASLVWIMDDPGGNAFCVGLKEPHRGRVYFWDHELEPGEGWDGEVESAGNLQLLADSFTEFVAGLQSDA